MLVRDAMTHGIEAIDAGSPASLAAALMNDRNIGFLVVMDDQKVAGVLTDRDIVVRSLSDGFHPKVCEVRNIMTENLIWCRSDYPVENAAELMVKNKIRRLLVVNGDYQPVGVLTMGDLVRKVHNIKVAGKILTRIHPGIKSTLCQSQGEVNASQQVSL